VVFLLRQLDHQPYLSGTGALQEVRVVGRCGLPHGKTEGPQRERRGQRMPERGAAQHRVAVPAHADPAGRCGYPLHRLGVTKGGTRIGPAVAVTVQDQDALAAKLRDRLVGFQPRRECHNADHRRVSRRSKGGPPAHRVTDQHDRYRAVAVPDRRQDVGDIDERGSELAVPAANPKTHDPHREVLTLAGARKVPGKRSHPGHRELPAARSAVAPHLATVQHQGDGAHLGSRLGVEELDGGRARVHGRHSITRPQRMLLGSEPGGQRRYRAVNRSTSPAEWLVVTSPAEPVPVTLRSEPVYRPVIAVFLTIFRLLGLRVTVLGDEHVPARGGAVLAITHFGYAEFALAGAGVWWRRRRLVRFLATKAAWRHPVAGPLMRGMHHIPVERAAGAGAYARGVAGLRGGELVGVFPEGMVSPSWTLGSFKTGAVRLAHEAQVPLIPVVIWGGHRVLTKGRRPSLLRAHRVAVSITFGAAVWPSGDGVADTAALRQVMAEMVERAQASYPDQPRNEADRWWLPAHLGGTAPTPAKAERQDRSPATH